MQARDFLGAHSSTATPAGAEENACNGGARGLTVQQAVASSRVALRQISPGSVWAQSPRQTSSCFLAVSDLWRPRLKTAPKIEGAPEFLHNGSRTKCASPPPPRLSVPCTRRVLPARSGLLQAVPLGGRIAAGFRARQVRPLSLSLLSHGVSLGARADRPRVPAPARACAFRGQPNAPRPLQPCFPRIRSV